jgi:hypothetical protein
MRWSRPRRPRRGTATTAHRASLDLQPTAQGESECGGGGAKKGRGRGAGAIRGRGRSGGGGGGEGGNVMLLGVRSVYRTHPARGGAAGASIDDSAFSPARTQESQSIVVLRVELL